jgi:hypothetical protein
MMSDQVSLAGELAAIAQGVLELSAKGVEDLDLEQLHYRAGENCNSIAFDAWHVARTADNLIHFAFERETPVWLQQGLNEAWGLPKADQGTGMSPEDAHQLRFPEGAALAKYCRDVADVIVPRIAAMSDEYLAGTITIKPQGDMTRSRIIGQVIIAHGSAHNGMLNTQRTVMGVGGLGI